MGCPEVADFARNFGVLVRVQGPDPKGLKMRRHAFHQYNSGKTTLSASGMLLPDNMYDTHLADRNWGVSGLVVTVASVIEPFLSFQHRQHNNIAQGQPELISGAQIDVMIEGKLMSETEHGDLDKGAPSWVMAQVIMVVDIPVSSLALQSLVEASSGSPEHGWEVGWSLASYDKSSQPFVDGVQTEIEHDNKSFMESHRHLVGEESSNPSLMGKSTTRIAILGVSMSSKDLPNIPISSLNKRGDLLLAVGSPFGVLSPMHFFNSYDSTGPCSCKYKHPDSCCSSPLPVQKTMDSVCLITLDDGVWASGVLLNDQGLILTNAHLLEPWRFGKTTLNGGRIGNESRGLSVLPGASASSGHTGVDGYMESGNLPAKTLKIMDASVDKHRAYNLNSFYKGNRNIRVRLDHLDPWLWCDAKIVYVCKGPLDVALLQLEYVPDQLCAIVADFAHPSVGSTTYVIGHGLFGPRCGLFPSVCSGVVSKVVQAKLPSYYQSILLGGLEYPVMLETTAAIHPGGSGGAVVNRDGHMIGLVTSNARHGGGTIIPHLNFSIPSAVLAPIFQFARDMQDLSLLQKLDQPNNHLASVWALMPPLSPKHGPSLRDLPQALLEDGKEGKGSRFAKFIAERKEILKNLTLVDNMGRISGEIFRSKL